MNKTQDRSSVDMLHGNILKSLILFIIPICISLICQQLYNTFDTIIVGHYLGENSLAAVGSASPIYTLLLSFCFGMSNGLAIVTSRSYGSGDGDLLRKTVAMSFFISLSTGLILTLIAQFGGALFLEMTNTPTEIMKEAQDYIFTISRFMIIMVIYNLCSSLLKSIGNSLMPLVFLMISSVINIGLDILFITQFHMGVKGAAIATVIAQGISVVLCFIYIGMKVSILIPEREHIRPDFYLIKEMLELGLSMGFMICVVNVGTVILQSAINQMGAMIIAGHATARNIFAFASIPITALSNGMATFSSQNYGANQAHRIREAVKQCYIISAVIALLVSLLMFFWGRDLVGIISGSNNEILLENGSRYVKVMGPFFISLGALCCIRVTLQGIGQKILPLLSSVIELAVKAAFAFILIPAFHYNAVIFCEPFAWTVMALELIWAFYKNPYISMKKKEKVS